MRLDSLLMRIGWRLTVTPSLAGVLLHERVHLAAARGRAAISHELVALRDRMQVRCYVCTKPAKLEGVVLGEVVFAPGPKSRP